MTYFGDLSEYSYFPRAYHKPGTKNIGWLDRAHEFNKETPSEETLNLPSYFCVVSVVQTRGVHQCEFCELPRTIHATRNGMKRLLGTSEIRVFSSDGGIYAAPTLVYHYICTHHYKPPEEFLLALREGPRPPAPEYFDRLHELGIEWNRTSEPSPQNPYRGVKINGRVEMIEVLDAIHWDED